MKIVKHRFGYFYPTSFVPKIQLEGMRWGGRWYGSCTNCYRMMSATTTGIRSGAVKGCTRCSPQWKALNGGRWKDNATLEEQTFNIYNLMVRRCADLTDMRYGGRGIRVCTRWLEEGGQGYKNFINDRGVRPNPTLTLEREDPDGDYTPENTDWDTPEAQSRNKSTSVKYLVCEEEMNQCDLAAELGINDKSLSRRVERWRKNGKTEEEISELLSVEMYTVRSRIETS